MTTVASQAARARRHGIANHTVTVHLTSDDLTMIRAFIAWSKHSPTCNPKARQIMRGYGEHTFPLYGRQLGMRLASDTTGPNVFKRLVSLGVIEHSRNGYCWLTTEGQRVARELA